MSICTLVLFICKIRLINPLHSLAWHLTFWIEFLHFSLPHIKRRISDFCILKRSISDVRVSNGVHLFAYQKGISQTSEYQMKYLWLKYEPFRRVDSLPNYLTIPKGRNSNFILYPIGRNLSFFYLNLWLIVLKIVLVVSEITPESPNPSLLVKSGRGHS